MTDKLTKKLDELIDYAQHALGEGYPYEVTEGDLRITLEALKLLRTSQTEPTCACPPTKTGLRVGHVDGCPAQNR